MQAAVESLVARLRPAFAGALMLVALGSAAQPAATGDAKDPLAGLLQERGLLAEQPRPASAIRDRSSDLVISAINFLGVRYSRGGASFDSGFDCSGFTRYIFESSLGLMLPRRVDEQAGASGLAAVHRADLRPGDLVFFNTLKRTFSHVGIYMGEGKFIHSPRTGAAVRVEDMRLAYWARRFTGARRAELAVE
jgi:cell wall-associated NlpC family hydrolase